MFTLLVAIAAAGTCEQPPGAANDQQAGIHWAQQGQLPKALPCFEAAAAAPEAQMADHYNLGSLHHELGNLSLGQGAEAAGRAHIERSRECFKRAIAAGNVPDPIVALQSGNLAILGDFKAAVQILEARLPTVADPEVRADFIRRLGDLAQVPFPVADAARQFDSFFRAGADLVAPAMNLADKPATVDEEAVARGIRQLTTALGYHSRSWQAQWIIGKGYEALGEPAKAQEAFAKAYALNRWNPDVARELVNAHLALGDAKGAVASEAIVALHPADATLLANHALVLLMRGDTPGAQAWVAKSLAIAPSDPITLALKTTIDGVAAGTQKAPERI